MAKPEAWRLDAASYPVKMITTTRFQDLDLNGHLNNVAFASLFENARVQLNRKTQPGTDRPANERVLVANVSINYLREGSFPDDVTVCSGVGHIGNSSWTIFQGMFQNGQCIATCDSVVVYRTDGEAKSLRQDLVDDLSGMMAKPV